MRERWMPMLALAALAAAAATVGSAADDGPGAAKAQKPALTLLRIAPQKVNLGDSLSLWVRAKGPSGSIAPIRISVAPLPLPAHARLDATTGVFTFQPDASQVGRLKLTFTASDGTYSASRAVTVTVKGASPHGVTSMTGRLLDSNSVVKSGKEIPVVGARVSFLGTNVSAVTNRQGKFTLKRATPGVQVFDIDASNAKPAPDGSPYAGFRENVTLIDHVTNVVRRPFYMPRVAAASLTTIDPNATTTVANAAIGVSFAVPPHTAKNANGTEFTGQMSISEVPDAVAPVAKPPGLHPGLLVTIQPIGVTFDVPVPITFPNRDHLAPGSEVNVWSLDPVTGKFVVVGKSVVSGDGASVTTTSGGVRAADWHFPSPPPPPPPGPPSHDPHDCDAPGSVCTGDSGSLVTLYDGHEFTGFRLPDWETLGTRRALEFRWSSARAAPQPILSSASVFPLRGALPPTFSSSLTVGGQASGSETFVSTAALSESLDEPFLLAATFDASALPTGTYPVDFTSTSNYAATRISGTSKRHANVVNGRESPFGHAWGIAGLSRVVVSSDGSALVFDGDGSSARFEPAAGARRDMLIADGPNDRLLRFNGVTGELVGTFVDGAPSGLDKPHTPTFGPDGNVYVVSGQSGNSVLRYDGHTGESLGVFVTAGSGGLVDATVLAFGPDGNLYTAEANVGGKVRRFSGQDGSYLGVAAEGHGISRPCGIAFGPADHLLYVLDVDAFRFTNYDRVVRFDGVTGEFKDVFVQSGHLDDTCQIAFGPDGDLYVPDVEFQDVRHFSGADGHFVGVFASGGPLATATPFAVVGGPDGRLYVVNGDVLRYDLATGQGTLFVAGFGGFPDFFPALALGATGTFESPAGDVSRLDRQTDGTFTRTYPDGRVLQFDAAGAETSDTDRDGNAKAFAYDAKGRLVRITDETGSATSLDYQGDRLSKVTDGNGRATTFEHDAAGNLVHVVIAGGAEWHFGYDARHLMTSETDPSGNVTTRQYDAFARWKNSTLPGGVVRSGSHAHETGLVDPASGLGTASNPAPVARPASAVSTFTDGTNATETTSPGNLGTASAVVDAAGLSSQFDVTANGDPLRASLPDGSVFRATFDALRNRLSSSDDVVGGTRKFTYAAGTDRLLTATDPFGGVTQYAVDAAGNRTQATSPSGVTSSATYAANGLLATLTTRVGTVAGFTYDARGNLAVLTRGSGPGQRIATFTRTPEGYVSSATDAAGAQTFFTRDTPGRIISTSLPGGRTLATPRDAEDRILSVTPPGGAAHAFEWSPYGLLTKYTAPAAGAGSRDTVFTYDAAQRLVRTARADGRNVDAAYDTAGRLATVTFSRGTITYSRSPTTGTLTSLAAPGNVSVGFTYSGNLATGETTSGAVASSVSSQYDKARRRTSRQVGNAPATSYSYDADGRVTQAGALTLTYAPQTGLLAGTTLGTTTDAWTWNAFGEEASYTASQGATTLYAVQDTRDERGRVTARTETIGGVTASYVYDYDAAGRLVNVTKGAATTATYTYDANGNRLTRLAETGVYDAQDRVTSYGAATFAHAASGERTSRTAASQTTSYTYDELGNLTRVDLPGGSHVDYVIDGLDRRVARLLNGAADRGFVWDGARIAAELDAAGAVRSLFVHASRKHTPDFMVRAGVTYRIVSDPIGSPRLVVDAVTGTVAQRMDYDEFGRVTADSNPGFQPFGFAGGLYDPSTGLVRFGARDYDAETGRFTAKDPTLFGGGTTNLYEYAANDPLRVTDPDGLKPTNPDPAKESQAKTDRSREKKGIADKEFAPLFADAAQAHMMDDHEFAESLNDLEAASKIGLTRGNLSGSLSGTR